MAAIATRLGRLSSLSLSLFPKRRVLLWDVRHLSASADAAATAETPDALAHIRNMGVCAHIDSGKTSMSLIAGSLVNSVKFRND